MAKGSAARRPAAAFAGYRVLLSLGRLGNLGGRAVKCAGPGDILGGQRVPKNNNPVSAAAFTEVRIVQPSARTIRPLPGGHFDLPVVHCGPRHPQEGTKQTYKLRVAVCFVSPKLAHCDMPAFSVQCSTTGA